MKKTGYKVISYDEDRSGLKSDATVVHIDEPNDYVKAMFEADKKLRTVVTYNSPNWNSFTKRVHVYTKKGR